MVSCLFYFFFYFGNSKDLRSFFVFSSSAMFLFQRWNVEISNESRGSAAPSVKFWSKPSEEKFCRHWKALRFGFSVWLCIDSVQRFKELDILQRAPE